MGWSLRCRKEGCSVELMFTNDKEKEAIHTKQNVEEMESSMELSENSEMFVWEKGK